MTAEEILIILLSVTLIIFLIVAICTLIMLFRVLKHVNNIAEKADNVVGSLATLSIVLRENIKPAVITATIVNAIQTALSSREKNSKKGRGTS